PSDPSASTGAARTSEFGVTPGCPTIGRALCVWRSQFAVLFASQIPFRFGLPAMRAGGISVAADAGGAFFRIQAVNSTAVAAAAPTAAVNVLPQDLMYATSSFQPCESRCRYPALGTIHSCTRHLAQQDEPNPQLLLLMPADSPASRICIQVHRRRGSHLLQPAQQPQQEEDQRLSRKTVTHRRFRPDLKR